MKLFKFILIYFLFVFFSFSVFAHQAWFGAEWTFTNDNIINDARSIGGSDDRDFLREKWLEKIKEKCAKCMVDQYTVTLPNGHWFRIHRDPWVLEVNASPMTLADIRENKAIFQALVWDTAEEVGLKPHYRVGGGHIHLDLEGHFQQNHNLFRNFIVDLANHPELFMGLFSLDYLNAPPLALLGRESIDQFSETLNQFDNDRMSLTEFTVAISKAYQLSRNFGTSGVRDSKYQAVNFNHSQTLELRGFRPQVSMEHFELIAEILTQRLEVLKKIDGLIFYNPKDYFDRVSTTIKDYMEHYETNLAPDEILDVLIKYLSSTGIDPLRYAPYVTEELQNKLEGSVVDYIANKKSEAEAEISRMMSDENSLQCFSFLNSAKLAF